MIFSPQHPMLKANLLREKAAYAALNLGPLLADALEKTERLDISFADRIVPGKSRR